MATQESANVLLTQDLREAIPPLYAQDGKGDQAVVFAKFFTPWTGWTWYVTEGCAQTPEGDEIPLDQVKPETAIADVIFFGYVMGLDNELGYFSMNELQSVKGPFGLRIERDLYWERATLGDVKTGKAR